ncbi:MAG: 2-oxoacid:acceptor oxidoreductase subunit alpha [Thermoplasmata archaeon]|nr:2-oxoacid:acceptor oxidoreductase subunit alpha [Thermoplasmata archaeon]
MTTPATQLPTTAREAAPAQGAPIKELSDLAVLIGGQGGDGTLTVSDLLARYFRRRGLYVYTSRNVLSRIRGGHADSSVRASRDAIASLKPTVDLLVAFDKEALEFGRPELEADGFVLYDSSVFQTDLPNTFGFPFATMAGSQLGQPIYKNVTAYGVISVMMGFDPVLTRTVIEERFKRRGGEALEKNLKALEIGRRAGLDASEPMHRYSIVDGDAHDLRLLTGNQAVALGFVVGGGRFFAGYPITPATEIMEYLQRYLPSLHGVVRQAEDELAAINMVIGAAYAGARAMTSTSGPGLSLMTEGIGHAGAAELPVLVADCQRVGPSTGEPTRHEQSDVAHLAHIGHGDFPRVLIAPGTVDDCFYLTVDALNIAEKWRLPVILVLDQALCQNSSTVPGFDLTQVHLDRGKRLDPGEVAARPAYKYYEHTPDGASPFAPPGTVGITSQVTGNEHDEYGHVSVNPVNRVKMMRKRMEKLTQLEPELPLSRTYGDPKATVGFIGFGSTTGPIREAQERLLAKGQSTRFFQARTLFPVPARELTAFLEPLERAYVVEHNYVGQFAGLIREALPQYHAKLRSLVKYDGLPFRSPEIARVVEGG